MLINLPRWVSTGEVKYSYLNRILRDGVFDGGIFKTYGMIQSDIGGWLHDLILVEGLYENIDSCSTNLKRGAQ